ncbi:MAG: PstS family phosphate ABC transporter substrate-binding protein, partial [Gaiellales bacterium]
DYVPEAAEQLIRSTMLNQPGALGIAGLATASAWTNTVRLLAVDFGDSCQAPTRGGINAGRYPLARELYVYVNLDEVERHPAQRAFVDYLVSEQGLSTAGAVGSVPLTPADIARVQKHWRSAIDEMKADVAGHG